MRTRVHRLWQGTAARSSDDDSGYELHEVSGVTGVSGVTRVSGASGASGASRVSADTGHGIDVSGQSDDHYAVINDEDEDEDEDEDDEEGEGGGDDDDGYTDPVCKSCPFSPLSSDRCQDDRCQDDRCQDDDCSDASCSDAHRPLVTPGRTSSTPSQSDASVETGDSEDDKSSGGGGDGDDGGGDDA